MRLAFSEISSVRHLKQSVDIFSHYLTLGQTSLIWATHHPYGTVAIAIASLVLLKTVVDLMTDFLRQGLQGLLRSPFRLIQWGLISGWKTTRQTLGQQSPTSVDEQIKTILNRLEALRQEQDILIQDLKTLLASK